MKTPGGKKVYAETLTVIFIAVALVGKWLQVPREVLRYRELIVISAIVSLAIFLLIEKSRHRKNHLSLISKSGRQQEASGIELPSSSTPTSFFVTENKTKHKQQQIDTEQRYRLLIQNSTDVITLIDDNGIIKYQSPALEKITGFNPQELKGKNVIDFIHPEDTGRVSKELLDGVADEGKTSPLILHRFLHKNGSWISIESHGTSHLTMPGINGIIINSRDVTERETQRKQLEDANAQLKLLFENVHEAFFSVDMLNNKILQMSPAHSKIYGRGRKEFLDNANLWSEVIHPDDKYLIAGIYQNVEAGMSFTTEYRIIKKDGTIRWIENKLTPTLNHEKRPVRIDGVISDITERKENETQIKEQFRALQKTNYELDRFVYSVSHDLRAPLTSIMGIINLAELENQTEQQRRYLEMIQYSVNRLDSFIKHILSYSKNAKSEITIEPIDFKELLEEIRANLKFIKGTERMKIKATINQNISFRSDRMRLSIILNNLFSNAIKYQDINKNDSYISIDITTTENEVRITVEDNGIGIDKKHLNKIFKMFYRVSSIAPGAGLGLYIVKEAIHKLGGDIQANSAQGEKTIFNITIPNK
jgi:PAS domain S-box-containing protein